MKINWNEPEAEEQKPMTPEEVRQAFRVVFGEEELNSNEQENQREETRPQINFPEMEYPRTTLAFQQIKPAQNPPIPAQNAPEPGLQPATTGSSEPKPAPAPEGIGRRVSRLRRADQADRRQTYLERVKTKPTGTP